MEEIKKIQVGIMTEVVAGFKTMYERLTVDEKRILKQYEKCLTILNNQN
jgi:hypothetical protein